MNEKEEAKPDHYALLEELEAALKSHDWFYMRSDDLKFHQRGKKSSENIGRLMRATGKDGKALFDRYRPRS